MNVSPLIRSAVAYSGWATRLCLFFGLFAPVPGRADVRLPRLVGDHMVLQRDTPLPIWGWAERGEGIVVTLNQRSHRTRTGPDGRWRVTLPALPAGGPHTLTIEGHNRIQLEDVLIGDVWLASGQSNMEWPLNAPNLTYRADIDSAHVPNLRLFTVPKAVALAPQADLEAGSWNRCSPETAATFSAVAFFFGRELHRRYGVPVGLILSAWGGTPAEAWTSGGSLKSLPDFQPVVAQLEGHRGTLAQVTDDYPGHLRQWQSRFSGRAVEPGDSGEGWEKTMNLPGHWEDTGALPDFDGIVWFRKEITLSAEEAEKPLTLHLARIDDADSTWFNGVKIGGTSGYDRLRVYEVPGALVKPGKNTIRVRVLDLNGGGGIWGEPDQFYCQTSERKIPLSGAWQYWVGLDTRTLDLPRAPVRIFNQNAPTALFNGMIRPLVPYAIRGVIWYQGENNAERAAQYRTLFPALIQDWRRQWGYGFPFLYVQLAAFRRDPEQPAESEWAELREAQTRALSLPGTAQVVTTDVGDPDDIHPAHKAEVGRRLALAARRVAYGENVVHTGPRVASVQVAEGEIRLTFTDVGSGLRAADRYGYLRGFALAGEDRRFVWATARLEGNQVVVRSEAIRQPLAVRYNWANSPDGNLFNREGLPALPFRSDDWPGLTEGRK